MKYGFLVYSILLVNLISFPSPRVSIISFIDENTWVDQMIAQISNQSAALELELIFVDTGIIDCGPAKAYEKLSSRIRVLSFDHTLSKSELLNRLLPCCKGQYLMLLTSGDTLNPLIVERYAHELDTDLSCDLVYANAFARYEAYSSFQEPPGWYWINKPEYDQKFLYYNLPGRQCMWRASVHTRCGLFNPEFRFMHLLEFWNRAAARGCRFKKIDATSGIYYIPYGTHKKLFNSIADNECARREMQSIHKAYSDQWRKKFTRSQQDKHFVIITASYKNAEWYTRNLDSILNQDYPHFRLIYIDDASPDGTGKLVDDYCKATGKADKITLIRNHERLGAVANIYKAAHMCDPQEIILIVDGDDWLAHPNVLNVLNEIYQDPQVWATYGQFLWFPCDVEGFAYPTDQAVIAHNCFRSSAWNITHLRTFYASLYQKINVDDLMYGNTFYPMTGDLAIMYPIMEMAGLHAVFVPDVIYIYNTENSLNDNKVNVELQGECGRHILCRPPYQPLSSIF